jgi:hypothetical protein
MKIKALLFLDIELNKQEKQLISDNACLKRYILIKMYIPTSLLFP